MILKRLLLFIPIIGLFYIILLNQCGFKAETEGDKKLQKIVYFYQIFIIVVPTILRQFMII